MFSSHSTLAGSDGGSDGGDDEGVGVDGVDGGGNEDVGDGGNGGDPILQRVSTLVREYTEL